MMKDLILSLAVNGRENYQANLEGLEQSIKEHWKGDVRIFREFPDYCTPHHVMNYQFKFDLIKQAVKDGYKRIFWLDSVMRLKKDISELLDQSNSGIVCFENEGHALYKYISDNAVNCLWWDEVLEKVTDIENILQIWGGSVFFDFNKPVAQFAFQKIEKQIQLGAFNDTGSTREGFVAHRFDQAVMSVIFDFYRVKPLKYGIIAAAQDVTEETFIQYGN